jgi:SAM-dependent methyltransferase
MSLSEDYDQSFFDMHLPWRLDYEAVAGILAGRLQFNSVVDLGCGNGFIIERLRQQGKEVMGVDGSSKSEATVFADLAKPLMFLGLYDLVICTELAEHVAEDKCDVLIDNICACAKNTIFFSSARPGSIGHLHVNEQPQAYWEDKFARRGFHIDVSMTDTIRADMVGKINLIPWFGDAMVLRK